MFTVELLIDGEWKRTEQEWATVEDAKSVAKEIDSKIKDHVHNSSSYNVIRDNNAWEVLCLSETGERYEIIVKGLKSWHNPTDYTGVRVAEVATSISINKSSWHYRFNSKLREMGSQKLIPSSLCPYFWLTVRNIVFSILVVVVAVLFVWAIGNAISVNLGLSGIAGFFASIGFGVLAISGMVLVAFLLFCVIMLINKAWVKFKDYRADKRIEKLIEIKLKKPDSMFTEVKRSFKDKVCPHITFKD
ncbi:membrane protein [Morganella phage vB_MmoM_MP1]|uniref:Uncharacterized protein n=1 Tax=Morganella phage vB_MmoM_MP1 TaxID=1852628 RepID=A0A192YA77_9CAUD|nr:membrane protein [Morganella phage vB_MmoM_MP1]ANM46452.1 hypothetical protein MP1_gp0076 [Morganella phage vB_MmoM_MP1]